MSTNKPEASDFEQHDMHLPPEGIHVGIVMSVYNPELTNELCSRTCTRLLEEGVHSDLISVYKVPGAHEIGFTASMMAAQQEYDVIIALGVVLAGETDHHSVIANALGQTLMTASCTHRTPIINGVLTVNSIEQAQERITGKAERGSEFALAAIRMAGVSLYLLLGAEENEREAKREHGKHNN